MVDIENDDSEKRACRRGDGSGNGIVRRRLVDC